VIDNKELAKYLRKEIRDNYGDYFISGVPGESELEFWITQFKARKCVGHSEWSERFQKNIWVSDYDENEDMTIEPFLSFEEFKKEHGEE